MLWIGMKEIRWQSNEMRMNIWRRFWKRRRVDGGRLQADAMHKVPELVAFERMSQVKKVQGLEEKKK